MTVALRKPMTREQFFRWAEAREGHYEFDGGQPVAMTGGTTSHSLVVVNIISELRSRLRGRPCRALSAEGAGVATTGSTIRYPDATVTCSPLRGTDRLVPDPVIVFEVVSSGNARTDRFDKMREYHAVPSIQRYVLVEQASPVLVSYAHQGSGPWAVTPLSLGDTLALPEVGVEVPVADIFDGVGFGGDEDPAAP